MIRQKFIKVIAVLTLTLSAGLLSFQVQAQTASWSAVDSLWGSWGSALGYVNSLPNGSVKNSLLQRLEYVRVEINIRELETRIGTASYIDERSDILNVYNTTTDADGACYADDGSGNFVILNSRTFTECTSAGAPDERWFFSLQDLYVKTNNLPVSTDPSVASVLSAKKVSMKNKLDSLKSTLLAPRTIFCPAGPSNSMLSANTYQLNITESGSVLSFSPNITESRDTSAADGQTECLFSCNQYYSFNSAKCSNPTYTDKASCLGGSATSGTCSNSMFNNNQTACINNGGFCYCDGQYTDAISCNNACGEVDGWESINTWTPAPANTWNESGSCRENLCTGTEPTATSRRLIGGNRYSWPDSTQKNWIEQVTNDALNHASVYDYSKNTIFTTPNAYFNFANNIANGTYSADGTILTTKIGAPTYTTELGINLMNLNGSSYQTIAANTNMTVSNKTESVSVWVYPTNENGDGGVLHQQNGWNRRLIYRGDSDRFDLVLNTGSASSITQSDGLAMPNHWYHLVYTLDGTNARLYVNGQQVGNAVPVGTLGDTNNTWFLGAIISGAGVYDEFIGKIAEFKFYKGLALGEDEIKALYYDSPFREATVLTPGECEYVCDAGYSNIGGSCVKECPEGYSLNTTNNTCVVTSIVNVCPALPEGSTVSTYNTVSSFVRTWSSTDYDFPTDLNTDYDPNSSANSCRYTCASGYHRSGSTCISNTRTYSCAALPNTTSTIYNSVSSYTQTWDGTAWTPASDATTDYNTTASTTSCRYKCASGYGRSGSNCIQNYWTDPVESGSYHVYGNSASANRFCVERGWSSATSVDYNSTGFGCTDVGANRAKWNGSSWDRYDSGIGCGTDDYVNTITCG